MHLNYYERMRPVIYLDNAATTKVDSRVLDAMIPYMSSYYGNAGASYGFGRQAGSAIQKAREQVAKLINADPECIIFTSGGSESNSLAIHGVKKYLKSTGKTHILISAVEHESVLMASESLSEEGFDVEYIGVSNDCTVSPRSIEGLIREDTGLVSVMFVNNETGAVNPVKDIGAMCLKRGILFHTDCVQAAGDRDIDVVDIGCDMMSISSHKIHGPKGVGCLYVKDKSVINPIVFGGRFQEFGVRGGTENVPGIVGFGEACRILKLDPKSRYTHVASMKQVFYNKLRESFTSNGMDGVLHINGPSPTSPGKTMSITIDGVDGQSMVMMLDSMDIYLSTGSACNSREVKSSHVLKAMGLSDDQARNTVRVSFSIEHNAESVSQAAWAMFICASTIMQMQR